MRQIHKEALLFSQSVVLSAHWYSKNNLINILNVKLKINQSNKKAETRAFVDGREKGRGVYFRKFWRQERSP